jgi:hypothetical protein
MCFPCENAIYAFITLLPVLPCKIKLFFFTSLLVLEQPPYRRLHDAKNVHIMNRKCVIHHINTLMMEAEAVSKMVDPSIISLVHCMCVDWIYFQQDGKRAS